MLYVTLHAAWMILAVGGGTVAGYMGLLRATQRPDGQSALPGRFRLGRHIAFGTAYYLMIYFGLIFGFLIHGFLLEQRPWPDVTGQAHLVLGAAIGILYAGAWILGTETLGRSPKGRTLPRAHMVLNFTACALVAVQIVLAAYYVWLV